MIPLQPQPEPVDFSQRVRTPGAEFLKQMPKPTSRQWKGKEYWRRLLPDMRKSYQGICAYCAQWIPHSTGNHSIDHFIPKSLAPDLAYEWSNFRYVSSRFNSRKGQRTILDPFQLEVDCFILAFPSLLIKPHPNLPSHQKTAVLNTINVLKLNQDDTLVQERQSWLECFCSREITFAHLQKKVPFIAYELERQKLVSEIASIMKISP